MHGIQDALIGDWHHALWAAIKALALFLTTEVLVVDKP
jgi:hypothetical protein